MDKLLELFKVFGPILLVLSLLALIIKYKLHWFYTGEKRKLARELNKYHNHEISKEDMLSWIMETPKRALKEKRLSKLKKLNKNVGLE